MELRNNSTFNDMSDITMVKKERISLNIRADRTIESSKGKNNKYAAGPNRQRPDKSANRNEAKIMNVYYQKNDSHNNHNKWKQSHAGRSELQKTQTSQLHGRPQNHKDRSKSK